MAGSRGGSLPAFVGRRLLVTIPLLFLISLIVFGIIVLLPGDPAFTLAGGIHAKPGDIARIRRELHLDQSFLSQYWLWLRNVLHGDLGQSLFQNQSVASAIGSRLPITLTLALGAMVVGLLVGLPLGILSGVRSRSGWDRVVTGGSSLAIATPDFCLATLLVIIFAIKLTLLPSIGYVGFTSSPLGWFEHLLMPWVSLGIGIAALVSRQVRGSLIDTLDQDYIRTAVAKGLPPRSVIGKHALKNALSPVVTVVGISFAYLIGGTFIVEQIYSLPGLGTYMLQAISSKDLPVIQGVALLLALFFVFINLITDVVYGYLNPKVRI